MAKKLSNTFEVQLDGSEETKKFAFKYANYKEVMALDLEYRRAFSEAVRNGVMTNAESIKAMRKTGAWTDEDDAEINQAVLELADLEVKLTDRKGTDDELDEISRTLTKKRNDILITMNKKSELFENTAEGVADQCRVYKMIYYCLVDDDGSKVFSSEDEFEEFTEKYPVAISFMYRKAYFFQYNINERGADDWAEVQYMREKAKKLKDDIDSLKEEEDAVKEAVEAAGEAEE